MSSNDVEECSYGYVVEENEVTLSENGFQPEVELTEFDDNDIQMVEEAGSSQDAEDETLKNAEPVDEKPNIEKTLKTVPSVIVARTTRSPNIINYRSNKILLKKANKSPGSLLLDGSALFDGTYFSFVAEHYREGNQKGTLLRKFKGKCAFCDDPAVYITGTGSSTYNFLRHLKRKHGEEVFQSYLSYRQSKSPKMPPKNHVVKKPATSPVAIPIAKKTVTIYVATDSSWKPFGNPRCERPLSSVILDDGISSAILTDVRDFISSSSWYHDRSIPYRRTYLLHGPSGCGKSSFVFALASELNFGLCVLHISEQELTDDKFNHLLNTTPENSVILLENIHIALPKSDKEQSSRLTLSGILNCLDGVTAPEGRILFLTCIDVDRLGSSLLRPGRIDVKQYFGFCSQYQVEKLFEKFYEAPASAVSKFVQEVMKQKKHVSPAQLQGFFLSHKRSDVQRLILDIQQIWQ